MNPIVKIFVFSFAFLISINANAQRYTGSKIVNASQNMVLTIDIDVSANLVTLEMTGPAGVWFAYGFGNTVMETTYALVNLTDGSVQEYALGDHNPGELLGTTLLSNSYKVESDVATSTVTRAITGASAKYFSFPKNVGELAIIWAFGTDPVFDYHATRGNSSIQLLEFCEGFIDANISETSCGNYTSPSGKYTWNESGIYKDTVIHAIVCDTIYTIDLSIGENNEGSETITACESYYWPANGETYISSGIHTATLENSYGCDSIVTLNLTISDPVLIKQSFNECDGFSLQVGENLYTETGSYSDTLTAANGCDSIVETSLNITKLEANISIDGTELIALPDGLTYQWIDCNSGTAIEGATNSNYPSPEDGNYSVEVSDSNCTVVSDCIEVIALGLANNELQSGTIVYPNPNLGSISIALNKTYAQLDVKMMNSAGQLVYSGSYKHSKYIHFEIENKAGIYFIELQTNKDQKAYYKIIIE